MKRFLNMIDATNVIVAFAGALIVGLTGLLIWAGKKWISNNENSFQEIKTMLKSIMNDLEEMKIEIKMTKNYVHEVEHRTEIRMQGNERQIAENRNDIKLHDRRISYLENFMHAVKMHHKKNHPEDNLNE